MNNQLRAYRAGGNGAGPMTFVASTSGVKRDGKDLDPNLWYLENYRKNPVFLWSHSYSGQQLPIGRADVEIKNEQLLAHVTFDIGDPFAREVRRKYAEGFLNSVSVGWQDIKINGKPRYDLLDVSAIAVPADPSAVAVVRAMERSFAPKSPTDLFINHLSNARGLTDDQRLTLFVAWLKLESLEKEIDKVLHERVRKVLYEVIAEHYRKYIIGR